MLESECSEAETVTELDGCDLAGVAVLDVDVETGEAELEELVDFEAVDSDLCDECFGFRVRCRVCVGRCVCPGSWIENEYVSVQILYGLIGITEDQLEVVDVNEVDDKLVELKRLVVDGEELGAT